MQNAESTKGVARGAFAPQLFVNPSESIYQPMKSVYVERQLAGLRHECWVRFKSSTKAVDMVPPEGKMIASRRMPGGMHLVAECPDHIMMIEAWGESREVTIASDDPEQSREIANEMLRRLQSSPSESASSLNIWVDKDNHWRTAVDADPWDKTERNYPAATRSALDALMARRSWMPGEGRFILLHGDPGTGKSSAIRTIAKEWASWCNVQLVIDPEKLFSDTTFLVRILNSSTSFGGDGGFAVSNGDRNDPWKIIVAEDVEGQLLGSGGGSGSLARLLNVTDGILGQGSRSLVLFSTNRPLRELPASLVRPGRILSNIEFRRFNRAEASNWLGRPIGAEGATLAELYEAERTGAGIQQTKSFAGQYL
jgi:hypothetical protein